MTNRQINKRLDEITSEIKEFLERIESEKDVCRIMQDSIEGVEGDCSQEHWDDLEYRWNELDAIYTDLHNLDFHYLHMSE